MKIVANSQVGTTVKRLAKPILTHFGYMNYHTVSASPPSLNSSSLFVPKPPSSQSVKGLSIWWLVSVLKRILKSVPGNWIFSY